MKPKLRRLIWDRAQGRCEYCRIHQDHDELPHHVAHIIAVKHRGRTSESNLALACANCSLGKGSNIAGADTRSGKLVRLFHLVSTSGNTTFVGLDLACEALLRSAALPLPF